MRYLLIVIFLVSSYGSVAQNKNYPIQTIFKGDSVVIMSTDQFQSLNILIETQRSINQNYREDLINSEKKIDSLEDLRVKEGLYLDSLLQSFRARDSVYIKLRTIESWLYSSAVDNAYIYYSWKDSTIKRVDLGAYEVYGNRTSGKLSFVRRGTNDQSAEWKWCNLRYPQEPEPGWELKYSEDIRPIVTNFPYTFKNNKIQ